MGLYKSLASVITSTTDPVLIHSVPIPDHRSFSFKVHWVVRGYGATNIQLTSRAIYTGGGWSEGGVTDPGTMFTRQALDPYYAPDLVDTMDNGPFYATASEDSSSLEFYVQASTTDQAEWLADIEVLIV